jgi:hypothetical protein
MANGKKVIVRENWIANFALVGRPKIGEHTFKIDERSEKSNWIYNSMNLAVDCGEKHGIVYTELMGGYGADNPNPIYCHGKKDDGSDDFKSPITVDWEDRFDEDILEEVGDMCFITVGLEKTTADKTYYKKFLSAYDAIAYVHKNLKENMVINVKGNLKYSMYNDKVKVKKNINSIVLSKVDDASKYYAKFTQSVLINKDSASLKNIDKNKSVMYVNAKVLDFLKEYKGIKLVNAKGEEKGGQFPFDKQFEFVMNLNDEAQCKKVMEKLFKVKKGFTQINFEGELIESGAVVQITRDDLPQDIIDLIEMGCYTEEEALEQCAGNGNREQRMVLKRPVIRLVGEEKKPDPQKFENKYTEDELYLDYLYVNNDDADDDEDEEDEEGTASDADADLKSWLDRL